MKNPIRIVRLNEHKQIKNILIKYKKWNRNSVVELMNMNKIFASRKMRLDNLKTEYYNWTKRFRQHRRQKIVKNYCKKKIRTWKGKKRFWCRLIGLIGRNRMKNGKRNWTNVRKNQKNSRKRICKTYFWLRNRTQNGQWNVRICWKESKDLKIRSNGKRINLSWTNQNWSRRNHRVPACLPVITEDIVQLGNHDY